MKALLRTTWRLTSSVTNTRGFALWSINSSTSYCLLLLTIPCVMFAISWCVQFRMRGTQYQFQVSQLVIMTETPEMQFQLVSSHGLLAILEVLESKPSRDVVMNLLKLTNLVWTIENTDGFQFDWLHTLSACDCGPWRFGKFLSYWVSNTSWNP